MNGNKLRFSNIRASSFSVTQIVTGVEMTAAFQAALV